MSKKNNVIPKKYQNKIYYLVDKEGNKWSGIKAKIDDKGHVTIKFKPQELGKSKSGKTDILFKLGNNGFDNVKGFQDEKGNDAPFLLNMMFMKQEEPKQEKKQPVDDDLGDLEL